MALYKGSVKIAGVGRGIPSGGCQGQYLVMGANGPKRCGGPGPNYFGDGSDGDCVISEDTTLQAKDYNFNNLTICNGVTLRFCGEGIPIIRATGTIQNDGEILLYNPFISSNSETQCIQWLGIQLQNQCNDMYCEAKYVYDSIMANYQCGGKGKWGGRGGSIVSPFGGNGGGDGENGCEGGRNSCNTKTGGGAGGTGTTGAGGGGGGAIGMYCACYPCRQQGSINGGDGADGIGGNGGNGSSIKMLYDNCLPQDGIGGGGGGGYGYCKGGDGGKGGSIDMNNHYVSSYIVGAGGDGGNSYLGDGGKGGDGGDVCGTIKCCGTCIHGAVGGKGGCTVYGNGGVGGFPLGNGGSSIYGNGGDAGVMENRANISPNVQGCAEYKNCGTYYFYQKIYGVGGCSLYGKGGDAEYDDFQISYCCGEISQKYGYAGFGRSGGHGMCRSKGGDALKGMYSILISGNTVCNNGCIDGAGGDGGNGYSDGYTGRGSDGGCVYIAYGCDYINTGCIDTKGGCGGLAYCNKCRYCNGVDGLVLVQRVGDIP